MLKIYLAVAAGGAAGAVSRVFVSGQVLRFLGPAFPWGTLGVNVLGSLLMGVLAGVFSRRIQASPELHALLAAGFLGGFTTFSAFSLDVVQFLQRQQMGAATVYAGASVLLCVGALMTGLMLSQGDWLK